MKQARYQESARWPRDTGARVRSRARRKLAARRRLRLTIDAAQVRSWLSAARPRLRRAAPLLAIVGLLLLAVVGGGWGWRWVTHSPRFALRHVTTSGHTRVTDGEILAAAALPVGANLFTTETSAVEARLERHPWIERARVTRRFPDGLRIDVTERTPAALVVLGAPYLAGADGRPFKRAAVERGEADGLPIVTGIARQAFVRRPDLGAQAVREALAVLGRYQARRPSGGVARPAIGEVHVSKRGVTLYTLEGAVALMLGRTRAAELDERLARFDVIWASLSAEEQGRAKRIHLDSATRPDRVTVELADAR